MTVPERELNQRMDALQQANRIRVYRAELKRDLKAGRLHVRDLIATAPEDLDPRLSSWKVSQLLLAVPKVGKVKRNKYLRTVQISTGKTLGGLSARQRVELANLIPKP